MIVYVVCEGEYGEGQSPKHVCSTIGIAHLKAQMIMDKREGYQRIEENTWQSGCNIVSIREFVVEGFE